MSVNPLTKKEVSFQFGSPSLKMGNWKDFFKNENEKDCPVKACKILAVGCMSGNQENSKITVTPSNDFKIESTNVENGWTEKLCMECNNGVQEV